MTGALSAFLLSALAAVVIVRQLLALERACQPWIIFAIYAGSWEGRFVEVTVRLVQRRTGMLKTESGITSFENLKRFEMMRLAKTPIFDGYKS